MKSYQIKFKYKLLSFNKLNLKNIKENPGVYIYYSKNKDILYIGKAKNLKRRIKSYQTSKLLGKTKKLISETLYFSTILVNSELESLLLEAKLVRKFKPFYNSQLKDDKNPLYIKITKEKYPKVLTVRKKDVLSDKSIYFGPFPKTQAVKSVLSQLRKIFPFSQHKLGKKPCIYSQIKLCFPCPNEIESIKDVKERKIKKDIYINNIKLIKLTLKGKMKTVKKDLENNLRIKSKKQDFESANIIKDKINKFSYITQPIIPVSNYLNNPNMMEDVREDEVKKLTNILKGLSIINKKPSRIECYDISHLSGNFPTASMVTFIDGTEDKSYYRHFRIRQKKGFDDLSSLKEVALRRKIYLKKWGKPDLIVVDGGKTQTNVFIEQFRKYNIPVVGIAKRSDSIIYSDKSNDNKLKQLKISSNKGFFLLKRLRDESHRFARRYHHFLLKKYLIPQKK